MKNLAQGNAEGMLGFRLEPEPTCSPHSPSLSQKSHHPRTGRVLEISKRFGGYIEAQSKSAASLGLEPRLLDPSSISLFAAVA